LELQRPESTTNGLVYITVDEVRYNDKIPWPTAADGSGPSLQRVDPTTYGNDPVHWISARPTPGQAWVSGQVPQITQQPQSQVAVAFQDVFLAASATGPGPLRYQWRLDGTPLDGATNTTLTLPGVLLSQAGKYDLVVYNASGTAISDVAELVVLIPADILQQPQDMTVSQGASAVFSVTASSSTPMTFQWRHNGVPIPGATNTQFALDDVQAVHDGFYDVVVTDGIGPITSRAARLTVLIRPGVLNLVTNYFVVQGGDVTLSLEVEGTLPMSYRWRSNFTTLTQETIDQHQSFLRLSNVQPSSARYSVVLTNQAFYLPGVLSPYIELTVLVDTDNDGLPDEWELRYGLDPATPGQADLDGDQDGQTNGEEYLAGTDPSDVNSYLKVDGIERSQAVSLQFLAVSNLTYTVQYKDEVTEIGWHKLADVVASSTNRMVILEDRSESVQRCYRLVTPRQP
jgi:hypothetical protein